jgi:hypothetical protein
VLAGQVVDADNPLVAASPEHFEPVDGGPAGTEAVGLDCPSAKLPT